MSVTTTEDEEKFEEIFGRGKDDLDGAIRNEENTVCLGTYGDDLKEKNRQITWDYTLASENPERAQEILLDNDTEVVDLCINQTAKTRIQKDYFEKAGEFFSIDLRENLDAILIHPDWNFLALVKPEDSELYLAIAPVTLGDE
jgi:hypothetical protein